jgi:HD-GYP domain-containing protein (c-di-GMP phosphodiesterase class II)
MPQPVRRAEIIAVLTSATALGTGQKPSMSLLGTVMSVAFARQLGWSENEIATMYWYGLIRYAGCHAESHMFSALVGDEIAFNRTYGVIDNGNPEELLPLVIGLVTRAHARLGPAGIESLLAAALPSLQSEAETVIKGHCDVVQRIAARLGFDEAIIHAAGQFRERWDGRGLPHHIEGESIDRPVRLVFLCHDVSAIASTLGNETALEAVRRRAGTAYEPALAEAFLDASNDLLSILRHPDPRAAVLEAEPGVGEVLTPAEIDDVCQVLADFCDLQLPHAVSHSRDVAALAARAGEGMRLPAESLEALSRAAWLHDLGYAAVPVRARGGYADTMHAGGDVRLHPFHSEDLVAAVPALSEVAHIIGRHHEALDGSGYFRGLSGTGLSREARLLAAAEAYQTTLEGRFGAAGRSPADAADHLRREVTTGRLDPEAVKAVLAAAGHRVPIKKTGMIAGLTNRELDILKKAASGLSMKEIGEALGISPKTVDNHLQSIYAKIEVKTRAGATLFAIEHGLCSLP